MGKVYEGIDANLAAWLTAQPMFVVGTAPLDGDGLINVSPKARPGRSPFSTNTASPIWI